MEMKPQRKIATVALDSAIRLRVYSYWNNPLFGQINFKVRSEFHSKSPSNAINTVTPAISVLSTSAPSPIRRYRNCYVSVGIRAEGTKIADQANPPERILKGVGRFGPHCDTNG
eukprot:CAMPEP_0170106578 /NCGR_PEP_ID=MMETSP0020_2-20130122/5469_1 /TAXON_ID=98059 /ORGANISM="Dinobryon sp., Strain UTEXLB2267" /LENGTH=113 /DNA_ID=CAMNT_0010330955 /DNA_START=337 /DNA_END=678 /DNA_ORIENTATION=+